MHTDRTDILLEARAFGTFGFALAFAVFIAQPAMAQDAPSGEDVYMNNRCITCHGAQGQGTIGAALAGSETVGDMDEVLRQIINGEGRMPAFGDQLSDAQIAAVATYIRTHFGNDYDEVSVEDVEAFRADAEGSADGSGS